MSAADLLDRLVWDDPQAVPVVVPLAHPPHGGCRLPAAPDAPVPSATAGAAALPTNRTAPAPAGPGSGA